MNKNLILSTEEQRLVKGLFQRQKQFSQQYGSGHYGPSPSEKELSAAMRYYQAEKLFPFIVWFDGPSCNLALVRQMQGEEGRPETKHARIVTSRGDIASLYSLQCTYTDGKTFTLRGDKYGWKPEFQLNQLIRYVDRNANRIRTATLYNNSRPAPLDWLYKWNMTTGEYQENSIFEPSPYPSGKDTFHLKKEEKSRILKKFERWFDDNPTVGIIDLKNEVTDQKKLTA